MQRHAICVVLNNCIKYIYPSSLRLLEDVQPSSTIQKGVVSVVGVYDTKKTALKQAKIKFEGISHACYEEGAFLRPEDFEETLDNCATVGDKGVVLLQRDMEGEEEKVEIQKMSLIED
jgi:hypothetical protein